MSLVTVITSAGPTGGAGIGDLVVVGGLAGVSVAMGLLAASRVFGAAPLVAAVWIVAGLHGQLGIELILGVLACAGAAAMTGHRPVPAGAGSPDDPSDVVYTFSSIVFATAASVFTATWWAHWHASSLTFDGSTAVFAAVAVIAALAGITFGTAFVRGSIASGGTVGIVTVTVTIAALILAAASIAIPFLGYLLVIACIVMFLRRRRQSGAKYKGLRILA